MVSKNYLSFQNIHFLKRYNNVVFLNKKKYEIIVERSLPKPSILECREVLPTKKRKCKIEPPMGGLSLFICGPSKESIWTIWSVCSTGSAASVLAVVQFSSIYLSSYLPCSIPVYHFVSCQSCATTSFLA